MARLNFDSKKIMDQAVKQGHDEMKARFKREILKIGQKHGEVPRISFQPKGKSSFDMKVDCESAELRKEIEDYIKKHAS